MLTQHESKSQTKSLPLNVKSRVEPCSHTGTSAPEHTLASRCPVTRCLTASQGRTSQVLT